MSNKAAKTLLKEYGYSEVEGVYFPARPSSEVWIEVEGGWECFQRETPSINPDGGLGAAWGRKAEDLPGYVQLPYTQTEDFKDVGGLHPANPAHAACFEWVWPEKRVQEIYDHSVAFTPEGQHWVKETDSEGNEILVLKGRARQDNEDNF